MRAVALLAAALASAGALAQEAPGYRIENGEIRNSLTGRPGDPAQGRRIVVDRQKGLCLLCHSGPFPEQRFQGDLAPSLAGIGSRMSAGALRLRMVDGRAVNPNTIMPPYFVSDGLARVAPAFRGKTILSAEEIEDVIAFLLTLKEDEETGRDR